ncbi:hypothetical protein JavanS410_0010 [Streptococcus satellite phage Javan410]|nr:hypothetical protein JavanS410_0010 [Streptococcus satellite phage Javan410]
MITNYPSNKTPYNALKILQVLVSSLDNTTIQIFSSWNRCRNFLACLKSDSSGSVFA